MFISQLGAIESFTRGVGVNVEGGLSPAIVKIGASRDTSEQVSYDVADPLTRALLLHSAQGGLDALAAQTSPRPGAFLEIIGRAYLPRVPTPEPLPPEAARATVEAECRRQTEVIHALGDPEAVLLPLLLSDDDSVVGSVISRKWVRQDRAASYLPQTQVGFGIVERVIDDLTLVTLIYLRPYF